MTDRYTPGTGTPLIVGFLSLALVLGTGWFFEAQRFQTENATLRADLSTARGDMTQAREDIAQCRIDLDTAKEEK